MASHRVFVSQETLDIWLADERVNVDGDVMTLRPEGQKFKLLTAFHFIREVADGGDEQNLVGKVKDLGQLTAIGGRTLLRLGDPRRQRLRDRRGVHRRAAP
jgi:hypothetical protein